MTEPTEPTETPETPESKPTAKAKAKPVPKPKPLSPPKPSDLVDSAPPTAEAAAATAVIPAADAEPAVASRSRRRLIRPLAIAGGAVIVVVAGLGITDAVLTAQHAPDRAVRAFLDRLVAGHAEAAGALLDPQPTTNDVLLDDDVYGAIETGRITMYTIVSSSEKGDTALVTAKLTDDTHTWTEAIHLDSTGRDLLWNVWAVDGHHLARVDVNLSAPAALPLTVNGVDLGAGAIDGDGSFAVFPGVYELAPAVDAKAPFKVDAQTVVVHGIGDESDDARFQVDLTDTGVAAANGALAKFLSGCISQHVLNPTGNCGYSVIDDGTVFTTITWTLSKRPTATFDAYDGTGFNVTTTTKGIIDFRGENSRLIGTTTFNDYEYYGEILFDGKGAATFESDYQD